MKIVDLREKSKQLVLRDVLYCFPSSKYSIKLVVNLHDDEFVLSFLTLFDGVFDSDLDIPEALIPYLDYPVSLSYYLYNHYFISIVGGVAYGEYIY